MSVNFAKKTPEVVIIENKFGIPVGTSIILSLDKFLFDKRDVNCIGCRNGVKSTIPKIIDGKNHNIRVVCSCVPYFQSNDGEGTGVVVYKGRRENWIRGIRSEADIQAELVREGQMNEAMKRKNQVEDNLRTNNNINGNSEYQKAQREKRDLTKEKQNLAKPPQKMMHQAPDGHWYFVTPEMGKKMGLKVSDVANPIINPNKPEEPQQPQSQTPPQTPEEIAKTRGYKGFRQESDEEFLLRTTGAAPVSGDVTFLSQAEAARIEASKETIKNSVPLKPSAPVAQPNLETSQPTKRHPGRPKGSKNVKNIPLE